MMRSYTYSKYFVTFEFESGDRLELPVDGSDYGLLVEGDTGKLSFQGTRYLGFQRGADLMDSTPRQILLQRALGLPTPRYLHLPLLLDAQGNKLSKSLAAQPVDDANPLPTLRWLWQVLGQPALVLAGASTLPELLQRAAAAFQPELLRCESISTTEMTDAASVGAVDADR